MDLDKGPEISIDFGLPNQVIGNPETAEIFVCLLNPRTRSDTSKVTNLKDYIKLENKNGGELFTNKSDYAKHIVNTEKMF